jgi:hypothetical protein
VRRKGDKPIGALRLAHTSAFRLFEKLKDMILNGHYQIGNVLPKVDYFVLSEHVSPTTVCETLRLLSGENLIHRRGKKWLVGPQRRDEGAGGERISTREGGLNVLLLLSTYDGWREATRVWHIHRFINELRLQLAPYGVAMRMAFTTPGTSRFFPSGHDAVAAHVKSMGNSYAATVAIISHFITPDYRDWISQLCLLKKPVILFDPGDIDAGLTRDTVGGMKNFYRLYHDETQMVSVAMEKLARHGHSRIGIGYIDREFQEWTVQRLSRLKDCIAKSFPDITLHTVEHTEDAWKESSWVSPDDFTAKYAGGQGQHGAYSIGAKKAEAIRKSIPSFMSLIDANVTALLAANDQYARRYYSLLQALGISVPNDISMISFDNDPEAAAYPITCVDRGVTYLSYMAARIIAGDIPVRINPDGLIDAHPTLCERGSVATPGKKQGTLK